MNNICIIPKPKKIKKREDFFELTAHTKIIVSDPELLKLGELLAEYLRPATGFKLTVISGFECGTNDIFLNLGKDVLNEVEEAYSIVSSLSNLTLSAHTIEGLSRSVQTLRQLLPVEIFSSKVLSGFKWIVPGVEINDSPVYSWRGMHLDVSRHFFKVEEVCRLIDILALHRFNKFHWHLTDDQGWRIEIKRYPRLTEVGSSREYTLKGHMDDRPRQYDNKPYAGFYTQDDIRKVVDFATKRHITVVPEIDMPGHMQAAIAAYPELGCYPDRKLKTRCIWGTSQNILCPSTYTVEFMKNVLSEVMKLFSSPFIHIGGDEAVKHEWEESRRIQELMTKLKIKDENVLQNWFLGQINEFLKANGRTSIGWDEILNPELPEGTIIMNWLSNSKAIEAARKGHKVIMAECEVSYFDFCQGKLNEEPLGQKNILPLEKVYNHDLIPESLPEANRAYIIGGQGQLWTEHIPNMKHLEYMAFPRAIALAEKLWVKHSSCSFEDFKQRLLIHNKRLDILNVNYRK
ncbi:MAG: beta-N-acetylhexosaminidase [Lentisphaeria bacterium]